MNGLHALVMSGKVLYLGISDTPAWIVSSANRYARDHGKTPFVVYQGAWSVLERDFERDIIPMVRHEGMALAPWNVLAGGKIRTDAEEQKRRETGEKGMCTVASATTKFTLNSVWFRAYAARPSVGAYGTGTCRVERP